MPTSRNVRLASGRPAILIPLMPESPLKTLADASLEATAAEEAVQDGAHHTASEALDRVDLALEGLRGAWSELSAAERAIIGPSAKALKDRVDAARRRIPRLSALSVGTAVSDPEEEEPPQ